MDKLTMEKQMVEKGFRNSPVAQRYTRYLRKYRLFCVRERGILRYMHRKDVGSRARNCRNVLSFSYQSQKTAMIGGAWITMYGHYRLFTHQWRMPNCKEHEELRN